MNPKWQAFTETREPQTARFKDLLATSSGTAPLSALCPTGRYSILEIHGNDAATFLQGQTTCDVLGLQPDQATLGAICNPKGRVVTTFFLYGREERYRLALPDSLVSLVETKLRRYVLRSKVVIEHADDSCAIFGICCQNLAQYIDRYPDLPEQTRYPLIEAGNGHLLNTGATQWLYVGRPDDAERQWLEFVGHHSFTETTGAFWDLLSILNGMPAVTPETSEVFVPQMLNLDALGGISFRKGCYTGQEIVARMHYLGKLKRRMVLAETRSERLPTPGEPVFATSGGQSVGQVVNAAWLDNPEIRMLLVLQTDQLKSDSIHFAESAKTPIKVLELPYTF